MRAGTEKGHFGLWWDLPSAVVGVSKPTHCLDVMSASATKTSPWQSLRDLQTQSLPAVYLGWKCGSAALGVTHRSRPRRARLTVCRRERWSRLAGAPPGGGGAAWPHALAGAAVRSAALLGLPWGTGQKPDGILKLTRFAWCQALLGFAEGSSLIMRLLADALWRVSPVLAPPRPPARDFFPFAPCSLPSIVNSAGLPSRRGRDHRCCAGKGIVPWRAGWRHCLALARPPVCRLR